MCRFDWFSDEDEVDEAEDVEEPSAAVQQAAAPPAPRDREADMALFRAFIQDGARAHATPLPRATPV